MLDPVGVGASPWRLANIQSLLQQVQPAIVRVNAGEAAALLGLGGSEHGVDSLTAPKAPAGLAAALAQKLGCVVLLSGTEDLIADGQQLCTVRGGSDRMRTVTGAGVYAFRFVWGVCRRTAGGCLYRCRAGRTVLESLRRAG